MQDFHGKSGNQQEDAFFHEQIKLKFQEESSKVLHFENRSENPETSEMWCWRRMENS
jgi:hypothetical protein